MKNVDKLIGLKEPKTRQQGERKKKHTHTHNGFSRQNNNFARASYFFVHAFLFHVSTVIARLRHEIAHCYVYANKQRRNFISLSELGYCPLNFNSEDPLSAAHLLVHFFAVPTRLGCEISPALCDVLWRT